MKRFLRQNARICVQPLTEVPTYIHKLYFISNLRVAFDKLMSSRKQGLTEKQKEERTKVYTPYTIYIYLNSSPIALGWRVGALKVASLEGSHLQGRW